MKILNQVDSTVLEFFLATKARLSDAIVLTAEGKNNTFSLGHNARIGAVRIDIIGNNNKVFVD